VIAWLLRLIGVSDTMALRLDEVSLTLTRPWWLLLGALILIPVGWWIARRHQRSMPHATSAVRRRLTGCRVGILLILLLIVGNPTLTLREQVQRKPIVAIAIDRSASMSLPAGPFANVADVVAVGQAIGLLHPGASVADEQSEGRSKNRLLEARDKLNSMTRGELVDALLSARRFDVQQDLSQRFDLRVYQFSSDPRRTQWPTAADEKVAPVEPGTPLAETNLGRVFERIGEDAAGRNIAAIVLLSDGRWTLGANPVDVARQISAGGASKANQRAAIWSIPPGGTLDPADIRIDELLAPSTVAKDDTVNIVVRLRSEGFDGRNVAARLLGPNDFVLSEVPLTLRSDELQTVTLSFRADVAGTAVLRVSIAEQEDELVRQNNHRALTINVEDLQRKLLYVEGLPRWDFRFLDHGLRRDNGMSTTVVLESQLAAARASSPLPTDVAGWAAFDVVLIGDISPDLLTDSQQRALVQAVREEGVGLIVHAGPHHMPHDFAGRPLASLLPTSLPAYDAAYGSPGIDAPAYTSLSMNVTAAGAIHPAFELFDGAQANRKLWNSMPGFYWCAALGKPLPGATVLAETEVDRVMQPLIVESRAGRGVVMVLGLDSTYRWRRNVGDHLFYRFWGQSLRHVARQPERGDESSWIHVQPQRLELGGATTVQVFAIDADGKPLKDRQVTVTVSDSFNSQSTTLSAIDQPGHYMGQWTPPQMGEYTLTYTNASNVAVSAAVMVTGTGREMLQPTIDRNLLGQLADVSGGGVLDVADFASLPSQLEGQPTSVENLHTETLWDNWLTLVALLLLYSVDLVTRRMMGLT
jgi:hypothetical protein